MLSSRQAHSPSTASEGRVSGPDPATTPRAARRRQERLSLLWRVFGANTVVFVVAVALLAWTPVTIHRVATGRELVALLIGLVLMLAIDLLLLHRTFAPLRRLATIMASVDPSQPGRRADAPAGAGRELVALVRALNAMLDRLEGERRESSRRALAAQEAERARIARELHDEVGQTLTAIALRAERAAAEPSGQAEALAEIAQSVQYSLDDVHRIGRELRPEALDDLGLVNALIALCARLDQSTGLRVCRDLDWHLPPLPADVELVIYRVAQEALTNTLRHAEATEVTVSLLQEGRHAVLSVRDDGHGLRAGAPERGILGMRERALLIDAELTIGSGPGRGTEIVLSVPVGSETSW